MLAQIDYTQSLKAKTKDKTPYQSSFLMEYSVSDVPGSNIENFNAKIQFSERTQKKQDRYIASHLFFKFISNEYISISRIIPYKKFVFTIDRLIYICKLSI